jgi:hypothetical protein
VGLTSKLLLDLVDSRFDSVISGDNKSVDGLVLLVSTILFTVFGSSTSYSSGNSSRSSSSSSSFSFAGWPG